MKIFDVSTARRLLPELLAKARDQDEGIVVSRYGRPIAAIVSVSRLRLEERRQLEAQLKVARAASDRPRSKSREG
jgi:prevent-host-death family protein